MSGWGVIRPGDRKAHYYDDKGLSLCRRIGFYNGPLAPDTFKSSDDCTPCRKQLEKQNAQTQK